MQASLGGTTVPQNGIRRDPLAAVRRVLLGPLYTHLSETERGGCSVWRAQLKRLLQLQLSCTRIYSGRAKHEPRAMRVEERTAYFAESQRHAVRNGFVPFALLATWFCRYYVTSVHFRGSAMTWRDMTASDLRICPRRKA